MPTNEIFDGVDIPNISSETSASEHSTEVRKHCGEVFVWVYINTHAFHKMKDLSFVDHGYNVSLSDRLKNWIHFSEIARIFEFFDFSKIAQKCAKTYKNDEY